MSLVASPPSFTRNVTPSVGLGGTEGHSNCALLALSVADVRTVVVVLAFAIATLTVGHGAATAEVRPRYRAKSFRTESDEPGGGIVALARSA